MPRYLIERQNAERLQTPAEGADAYGDIVETNAEHGVTWIHSYMAADRSKTFCICEAPSPEAIRAAARMNRLPVDRITEVRVLDPYSTR